MVEQSTKKLSGILVPAFSLSRLQMVSSVKKPMVRVVISTVSESASADTSVS
jgi:hypothetical protein